jgi:hypothetical protein
MTAQRLDACPQRGNRSTGDVNDYAGMVLRGHTLEQIGDHFGVTHGAVRKALKRAGLPTNSRALLAAMPEGCTPTDAAVLRAANQALAAEVAQLKSRLSKIKAAVNFVDPD